MTAPVLLLSDLHLPNTPSPLRASFLAFLAGPARAARAVYILGDLFEVWIGDAEGLRDYAPETSALRRLADAGVPVSFMPGNRDFLVGRAFAQASGVTLLRDPAVVRLAGVDTLLSHGDALCTDDRGYQRWRRFSRNELMQAGFRRLPAFLRRYIAGVARTQSELATRNKPEGIMDVNESAVREVFALHSASRLIHGHTHRPAEHRLDEDGRALERIVLADWRPGRLEYLIADEHGLHRATLPYASA